MCQPRPLHHQYENARRANAHRNAAGAPLSRRAALALGLGAAAGLLWNPRELGAAIEGPPLDPLDVALRAERWIRRSRIETGQGVVWPANPLDAKAINYDLYNGVPGVVLFYIELFDATGDQRWLDEARRGAAALAAQLPAMESAKQAGFYEGIAGAVFVLEETHRVTGEARFRDAALSGLSAIRRLAQRTSQGASWPGGSYDIISGSAGIGLLLIWAEARMGDPANRELALAAGRALLDAGVRANDGLKWAPGATVTTLYPNFSHGTSGVGFFLATLLKATGDMSLMSGALSAAHYLETVANREHDGFKVFHHEPGGEALYYLSWCHGPAGTSRFFERMRQITGRDKWKQLTRACATATIDGGVPERQSAGYWNNVGQCCGNAGVGEYFIVLARRMGDPAYKAMVDRVSANTLSRATVDGDGLRWVQAENRVSPADVVAQTGYMQGAAGIGTYFLHADGLAKGRAPLVQWPDSPAFDPCLAAADKVTPDMSSLAGASSPACRR